MVHVSSVGGFHTLKSLGPPEADRGLEASFNDYPSTGSLRDRLHVVGAFAVGRDVETLSFLFFRDSQTHDRLHR